MQARCASCGLLPPTLLVRSRPKPVPVKPRAAAVPAAAGAEPPAGNVSARDAPPPPVAGAPLSAVEGDLPATARELCGKGMFFAMAVCLEREGQQPRYRDQPECVRILNLKRSRVEP